MRAALAIAALLLAGCSAGGGASPEPATSAPTPAPVTPTPAPPSVEPNAPASEGPIAATEFTPDDEEIAKIVSTAVDEAIPQLKVLNDSDPSKLEDLFVPLGDWITSQRTSVESMTPSSCTVEAVALFEDGLDQYDAIRKKFLAWRDWGANGNAFPPGAPREAADTLQAAVDELGATCPS